MGATYECEIQARVRDINIGGHVDSVEAVRIIDEGRLRLLHFADLPGLSGPGLFADRPDHVVDLMASQRVDYHAEMRFVAHQPFLLTLWVDRIGRSSFTLSTEVRVAADRPPAVLARSTVVLWDTTSNASWPMNDGVRGAMESYLGEPVALRG